MDQRDLQIIEELRKFGVKFTQIAKKLGITEAAVRKRVKKLLEEGVIKGGADIDWLKLGALYLVIAEADEENFYRVGRALLAQNPVMLFSAFPKFIGLFKKVPKVDGAKIEIIRLIERII